MHYESHKLAHTFENTEFLKLTLTTAASFVLGLGTLLLQGQFPGSNDLIQYMRAEPLSRVIIHSP